MTMTFLFSHMPWHPQWTLALLPNSCAFTTNQKLHPQKSIWARKILNLPTLTQRKINQVPIYIYIFIHNKVTYIYLYIYKTNNEYIYIYITSIPLQSFLVGLYGWSNMGSACANLRSKASTGCRTLCALSWSHPCIASHAPSTTPRG